MFQKYIRFYMGAKSFLCMASIPVNMGVKHLNSYLMVDSYLFYFYI